MGFENFYMARNRIQRLLEMDLQGPVREDEVIAEPPLQYYIMAKLYPQSEETDIQDATRSNILESGQNDNDAVMSQSNTKNPSSMGLSFTVDSKTRKVRVICRYATYEPIGMEEARRLDNAITVEDKAESGRVLFWKRISNEIVQVIDIGNEREYLPFDLGNNLEMGCFVHRIFDTGECAVSITLMNKNDAGKDFTDMNRKAFFQPLLEVYSADEKNPACFVNARRTIDLAVDEELLELDLLYQNTLCFAQGHGCAAEWESTEGKSAFKVSTTFMPEHNLLQMSPPEVKDTDVFGMEYLAKGNAEVIIHELRKHVVEYGTWIDDIEKNSRQYEQQKRDTADRNLQRCRQAKARIIHGIDLLASSAAENGNAWKAFRLANESMFLQRSRSLIRDGKVADPKQINWYPFQLFFILQLLPSFMEPDSEDRRLVDLLWFPTGGGKTEAYLGISSFLIFYRLLVDGTHGSGTAVLMRYTLRLLTLQQFERASILICACEMIRRREGLGNKEISIGLWIGSGMTPNKLDDAASSIRKQQAGQNLGENETNPCQVKRCPWCGATLNPKDYSVNVRQVRLIIRCPNDACEFRSGLPIHLVDQEIYSHVPSFIVATVDKFAQLPYDDRPGALFGLSNGLKPPELIIQDELHLISGPLGTVTGIYETAITKLCENNGIPVKIVASTATIRNASGQITALFGRKHFQFPPQGVDIRDSFFARLSDENSKPARKYLGCMGVGTTSTTTLIRINAALLFASRHLASAGHVPTFPVDVIDNYWTITGYFNSLRELGGAKTQLIDDVQSRFSYLVKHKFARLIPTFTGNEKYEEVEELTSRMGNARVSDTLEQLKKAYDGCGAPGVYDFVLASNMLSVGVDVGRLGTMVVAGQPKTNSEYIQATSRVGRQNPGLVVALYNPIRSRDRSHYEQFTRYHAALYRYVEATSLTPFSDRARDKGLHALYVILCRHLVPTLRGDSGASHYRGDLDDLRPIIEMIREYVSIVDQDEYDDTMQDLGVISDQWEARVNPSLVYRKKGNSKVSLLQPDTKAGDRFSTMNSMRNVDCVSGVYLLRR